MLANRFDEPIRHLGPASLPAGVTAGAVKD
jgi:hypothetical protein